MPPAERPVHEQTFEPQPADIDELGHVNNTVYLRWVQDMATAHWRVLAPAEDVERFVWVVLRHEIDYRRASLLGETLIARTWVGEPPKGARFDRIVEIVGPDGGVRVAARTTWAMLDRSSMRPLRVPRELAAPFLGQ